MIDGEKVIGAVMTLAALVETQGQRLERLEADWVSLAASLRELHVSQAQQWRGLVNELAKELAARTAVMRHRERPEVSVAALFDEYRENFKTKHPDVYDPIRWGERPAWLAKAMAKGNGA